MGAPFTVAVIQIPLRFQTVYGISALGAGIRLLPFAVLTPVGSGISAAIAGKAKVPPIYLMLVGAVIQIIGFALLSTGATGTSPSNAQYGYQAIAGFGVGMNLSNLILMTPFAVEKRDKCSWCQQTLKPGVFDLTFSSSRCYERHGSISDHGWRDRIGDGHGGIE